MMKTDLSTQIHYTKGYDDYQNMAIKHLKQEDLSCESHLVLTTADSLKQSLSTHRDASRVSPFKTVSSPDTSADHLQVDNSIRTNKNSVDEKLISDQSIQQNFSKIDYFFDNFNQIIRVTFISQQQNNNQIDYSIKPSDQNGIQSNRNYQQQPIIRQLLPTFDRVIQEQHIQNISSNSNSTRNRCISSSDNISYDHPRTQSYNQISQPSPQQQQQSAHQYMFPKSIQFPTSQQTNKSQILLADSSSRNKDCEEESFLRPQPSNEFDTSLTTLNNFIPHNNNIPQQLTHTYQMINIPSNQSISSLDINTYSSQSRNSMKQSQLPSSSTSSNLPPNYSTSSYQPFNSQLPPTVPSIKQNHFCKTKEQTVTITQQNNTINYHNQPPPLPQSTRIQLNGYNTNHFNPQRFKFRNSLIDKENCHDSQNININLCDNPPNFQPNQTSSSTSNTNITCRSHSSFSKPNIPPVNISQRQSMQSSIMQKVQKTPCGQFFHTPSTKPYISVNLPDQNNKSYQNYNNNLRYQITQKPPYLNTSSIHQHSVSSYEGSYEDNSTIQLIPQAQCPQQQVSIIPKQLAQFTEETTLNQRISQRLRTESTYLPNRQEYQQSMQQQYIQPIMGRMRAISATVSEQPTRGAVSTATNEQTIRGQNNRQLNSQYALYSKENPQIIPQNIQQIKLSNYLANRTITYPNNGQTNVARNNTENLDKIYNKQNSSNQSNNNRNTIPRSVPVIVVSGKNSLQSSMQRDHSLTKISQNNIQANLISRLPQEQRTEVLGNSISAAIRIPQAPRSSSYSYSLHQNID